MISKRQKRDNWVGIGFTLILLIPAIGAAAAEDGLSTGQTVYVPAYLHIIYGDINPRLRAPFKLLLSSMLSIRNVDPNHSIMINAVRYYDTGGKLLRDDNAARTLAPLASTEVFVEFKDEEGGAGAKFIVVWQADVPVNPPLVESVNAHFTGTQLTVFTSRGQPIK